MTVLTSPWACGASGCPVSCSSSPVPICFCVYAADFFASLQPDLPKLGGLAERALGFFRLGTGFWLMYLVFAVALNFVLNYTLPL